MRAKLPAEVQREIRTVQAKRYELSKLIAKLSDEKRGLPKPGALARIHGVSRRTIARIIRGEPYRV